MAINIPRSELDAELDRALRDAGGRSSVPALWRERVEWLGQYAEDAAGKTYIAALGAALLAKATDPRVDSLAQTQRAGPRGYSLRSVAEFLQGRVRGRVHLGTLSKWPLNNSPFFKGPPRIEQFTSIAGHTRPLWEEFVRWLEHLDTLDGDQAHSALVAFLRVRMDAQQATDARAAASPRVGAAKALGELVRVLSIFVTENPEGGSRGQAVVAAALDCVYDDIEVLAANHPAPFDVRRAGSRPPLVVEVKQQPITERDVLELARRAAEANAGAAIYAALDPAQPALPTDRLIADALNVHGVPLDVFADIPSLVARISVHSAVRVQTVARELPQHAIDRCDDAGVSEAGRNRLATLLRGISA